MISNLNSAFPDSSKEPAFLITHFKWGEKIHDLIDYLKARWPRARLGLVALDRLGDGLSTRLDLHWCRLLEDSFPLHRLAFSRRLVEEIRAARYDALFIPVKKRPVNAHGSMDMSGYPWVKLFAWRTGIRRAHLFDPELRFYRITRDRMLASALTDQGKALSKAVQCITTNTVRKNRLGVSLRAVWKTSEYLQDPVLKSHPRFLTIEPTNLCNLRCAFCECGQDALRRPKGSMSFDRFKALLDRFPKTLETIFLNSWGESFLHPRIYDMILYAKHWAKQVTVDTNGNHLDPEKVVRSGLDNIVFAVDGLTQETYERLRVNGSLDRVLRNLAEVIEWRKRLRSHTPRVTFKFIVMAQNEAQIDQARQLSKELGADQFLTTMFTARSTPAKILPFLPSDERYSRYVRSRLERGKVQVKYRTRSDHCSWLWSGMTIYWDGSVYPCAKYPFNFAMNPPPRNGEDLWGNIFEVGECMDVWNGPTAQSFRRGLLEGKNIYCQNCSIEEYHD